MFAESEIYRQILAVAPVCYNEFTMGMGYGWTAPILTKLKNSGYYSVEELSWIGSIHEFGRVIGPSLAAVLLDRIGRKKCLIICSLLFLASWFGIIFAKSVLWICLFRLIFGIGNGINDVTSSVYLGENYPSHVRGIFCVAVIVCFCVGELLQFVLASWIDYRTIAIINCSIAFVGVLVTGLLVETPQFLLMKNERYEACRNFSWLRGVHDTCGGTNEFAKIKQNIEEERRKKASFKELFKARANYKSLTIIFMLNVFTMGTGYAAVQSYMTMVFSSSGTFSEYQFTMMYAVIQLIASFSTSLLIERFDRRVMVLLCYASIAGINTITAILLYVQQNVTPMECFPWLIFSAVSIYGAIYAVLFPVVHMIRGELFPQSIKAIGGFVAITTHSIMAFVTTRIFLSIANDYGTYSNFLLYAVMSLMAFVYNYSQLPETRGKLLVDIQKCLE
ncbi:facilitated trehalose transporter Tret1-like [Planococcus citri]|uniref:facilitated trehalose transporter Tret1-like n=1 Tax=Planococcus citri TaxID=170843 RepID=UPI0031F77C70